MTINLRSTFRKCQNGIISLHEAERKKRLIHSILGLSKELENHLSPKISFKVPSNIKDLPQSTPSPTNSNVPSPHL